MKVSSYVENDLVLTMVENVRYDLRYLLSSKSISRIKIWMVWIVSYFSDSVKWRKLVSLTIHKEI